MSTKVASDPAAGTTAPAVSADGAKKSDAAAAKQVKKEDVCCPEFSSQRLQRFNEKEITFASKPFVRDKICCFLYMPLNFGRVMKRACAKIDAAEAAVPDDDFIMLNTISSPWKSTVYLSTVEGVDVPGAEVVTMTGTFLTKVFEGPYSKFDKWIKEMKAHVKKEKGDEFDVDKCEMYAYYTTCPKCAKKYGKTYTVLFVKVA